MEQIPVWALIPFVVQLLCIAVLPLTKLGEWWESNDVVTLITRPRRFGKTLALNMLKTFFEKTDEDTAKYFANRKIWQCGEKYRQMQGAFAARLQSFSYLQ